MKPSGRSLPRGLHRLFTSAILICSALITACSPVTTQQTIAPSATKKVNLTPYFTNTPKKTPSPSIAKPTKTPLPPPTATPFTHTIKKDETLLGIAFKYGVKLEDLLAANPGVNIHFLTIGTVLVVPLNGNYATSTPTIAPPLLQVSEPVCYTAPDSNLNCLAEITNSLEEAYEKITLRADLFAKDGTLISQQYVAPPLEQLLPGSKLPVIVSYSGADLVGMQLEEYSLQLTLLSALAMTSINEQPPNSPIEAAIHELKIKLSEDQAYAKATGKVAAPEGTSSLWLVSIAYDHDEKPIGLRKIEINDICLLQDSEEPGLTSTTPTPLTCAETELPFDLHVYSLGPPIEQVKVLAEAHR